MCEDVAVLVTVAILELVLCPHPWFAWEDYMGRPETLHHLVVEDMDCGCEGPWFESTRKSLGFFRPDCHCGGRQLCWGIVVGDFLTMVMVAKEGKSKGGGKERKSVGGGKERKSVGGGKERKSVGGGKERKSGGGGKEKKSEGKLKTKVKKCKGTTTTSTINHSSPPTSQNLRAAHLSRSINFKVRPYHQRPSELMTEPTRNPEDKQPQLFGLETSCAFSPGWSRTLFGVTLWPWAGPEFSLLTHPLANCRYYDSRPY
ncbi:hypothetical protein Pmani_013839 [Petrolisthes manimaculis]|uniref:Uncharacterized protein n=1 Tax=Petrolisthes manimaculis TaxID=1843537 RepID=A0AAE1U997_9EUCA|nr:hypothetical protein Pmani_013839 [Petrolisthes manimaculis]